MCAKGLSAEKPLFRFCCSCGNVDSRFNDLIHILNVFRLPHNPSYSVLGMSVVVCSGYFLVTAPQIGRFIAWLMTWWGRNGKVDWHYWFVLKLNSVDKEQHVLYWRRSWHYLTPNLQTLPLMRVQWNGLHRPCFLQTGADATVVLILENKRRCPFGNSEGAEKS